MRASGILLHITSLPSSLGVGTLAEVDRFVDFLHTAKQQYWQILPVTPTDFVNSPYASPSAFAGNTLLIDADELCEMGLVSEDTLLACKNARGNDFAYAIQNKETILREAFANFIKNNPPLDYDDFYDDNAYWLNDYALFCALKQYFGGKSWAEWDDENVRMRKKETLNRFADELRDEVDYHVFCQYVFDRQWKKFRSKLKAHGIKLIGDIPMYVAYDSADVWAHSELFELTPDRRPKWVAGVPPDYFSADGQLWGNPLYKWEVAKSDGYKWWTKRVGRCAELFDVLRIDHFRAFDSYYAIKHGEKTAVKGRWKKGVGYEFIKRIQDAFPDLAIVAEDLGDIPQSVLQLRDKCGLAGMKVVQFAFDGNVANPFLFQNFEEHCVAYLGTHDNDTTVGWWNSLSAEQRKIVLKMTGMRSDRHVALQLVELLAYSRAELVIYSLQDLSENDTSSRMNTPGTLGCWKYMAKRGDLSAARAKWLANLTKKSGRVPQQ